QVQLVHQAPGLQKLQGPVHRDAIQLRILLLGELVKLLGIEMLAGIVDQIQENLTLASQTHATLAEGVFCGGNSHSADLSTVDNIKVITLAFGDDHSGNSCR